MLSARLTTTFSSPFTFFDPSGHRLELCANVERPGALEKLYALAPEMIEEWSRTKRAPRHAAFMHEKEFNLES